MCGAFDEESWEPMSTVAVSRDSVTVASKGAPLELHTAAAPTTATAANAHPKERRAGGRGVTSGAVSVISQSCKE